jgi:predicted AlkP superfamily phosphohydrolase/phosphomutase
MLRRLFLSLNDVDWSRTRAFSVGNFGQVYLNVKGRRPQGAVEPGAEYEALRGELIEKALALRDPDTGDRVIQAAYRSEEVFAGRAFETMPDLVLHTDRAKYVSFGHADFGSRQIVEPSFGQTGHHHMQGVVVLRGPDIRQGVTLEGARLLDIAPTALYAMGLPVPRYMDGVVLVDAFKPEALAARSITFSDDDGDVTRTDGDIYSEEDKAAVMERLRDLGYVS